MVRKKDYFKLGLYIILGTGMLLAVVVILGAGRYFQTTFPMETYFDESVNGLSVGSPVKLRGVQVGRVAEINFVSNIYPEAKSPHSRYVYVLCEINPDLFKEMTDDEFVEHVDREAKRGMRIRPTSLGLTGQLFLNTIYQDPKANPPLPVDWTPEHAYIPSVPSTLSRVEEAVTTISKTLSGLKQEDLQSIIKDVKSIVGTIDHFMKTEGGKEAGDRVLDILQSTRGILARADKLLADPTAGTIIPHAASILSNVDRITTESADNIIKAAAETRAAIASFKQASQVLSKTLTDPRMDKAMAEIAPSLENISRASADLAAAVTKVHTLINRLNGMAASQEANVQSIIEDTREVMQNVKELTDDAKRYPSGVIFGNPPSKPHPEGNYAVTVMKRYALLIALLVTALAASACVKLGSKPLEKRYYQIAPTRTAPQAAAPRDIILLVRRLSVSDLYNTRELVYRGPGERIESDFYNMFFVSPANMLTTELRRWLRESGRFQHIIEPGSMVVPGRTLEGAVNALYGDYSATPPAAVVEMQFLAVDESTADNAIVFSGSYSERIPLADGSPAALVKGLTQGVEAVFTALESDLAAAPLKD